MGWKIQLALVGALVAGILLFRRQISGALSEAGTAVGEGVGGAFGGFLGGLPSGFVGAVTPHIPPGEDPATGRKTTSPWGLPGPWDFLVNPPASEKNVLQKQIIIGGSQPTQTDMTITPSNRDYSDAGISPIIASRIVSQTQQQYGLRIDKFTQIREQALDRGRGSAQATAYARQSAGITPKNVFDIARQRALLQGATPAEALRIARMAIQ